MRRKTHYDDKIYIFHNFQVFSGFFVKDINYIENEVHFLGSNAIWPCR